MYCIIRIQTAGEADATQGTQRRGAEPVPLQQ
jgi:hypothetical protein